MIATKKLPIGWSCKSCGAVYADQSDALICEEYDDERAAEEEDRIYNEVIE